MAGKVRVAAAQYPIEELTNFTAFESKLTRWVDEAVSQGAKILVFPEYAAMELTRLAGRHVSRDLQASLEAMQYYLPDYKSLYRDLSKKHGIFILAGSAPIKMTDSRVVNRARLFAPSGASAYQQKHIMTRFEREEWGVSPSSGLCVFDIGILAAHSGAEQFHARARARRFNRDVDSGIGAHELLGDRLGEGIDGRGTDDLHLARSASAPAGFRPTGHDKRCERQRDQHPLHCISSSFVRTASLGRRSDASTSPL